MDTVQVHDKPREYPHILHVMTQMGSECAAPEPAASETSRILSSNRAICHIFFKVISSRLLQGFQEIKYQMMLHCGKYVLEATE